MGNNSNHKIPDNQESGKRQKEFQSDLKGKVPKKAYSDEDAEADLNEKILKITMTIMEQYPELSKYIEEMPVTIPNDNNPEIKLGNLKTYYESLSVMLNKYKTEHPDIEN